MKASEIKFLEFLRQADQLTIPIYQRPYSWARRQWEQLWSDIIRAAQGGEGHFVGSIVYILGDESEIGRVNPAQVIDGQQRLTTISLLLVALARHLEADGAGAEMTGQRLRSRYLVNRDEEGEDRYKLMLTKTDKETLIRLLDGYDAPSKALTAHLGGISLLRGGAQADAAVPGPSVCWAGAADDRGDRA